MPRSQRTQLKKAAVTEVPLGQLTSGVTQRVNMPTVQPQKTAGQALAEGLGVAAKAGAQILQQRVTAEKDAEDKIDTTYNRVQGSLYGTNRAREKYDEIVKSSTSPENTIQLIGEAGKEFFEELKQGNYAKNPTFIEKGVTSFTTRLDSLYKQAAKAADKNEQKNAKFAVTTSTTAGFAEGTPALELLDDIDNYQAWQGSNAERLMTFTEAGISYAKEEMRKQLSDPTHEFDLQQFKDNYLEIKTAKGVSLLQNPATGDKIRQFYNSMTGELSKEFTKAKDGYKEQTKTLEANPETTPIDFSNHLKEGASLGFYEDSVGNPEVGNLQASFDKKYVKNTIDNISTALTEQEKSASATLKDGEVYVKGNSQKVLETYKNTLQTQVNKGFINPEEAAKSLNEMIDRVDSQQQHHTYLADFKVNGVHNDKEYKELTNASTKKAVKARILTSIGTAEGLISSATTPEARQSALEGLVAIINNNSTISQPVINTRMPFTTNLEKVQSGLAFMEDLSSVTNGTDVINTMSTRNRNFYTALNALTELEGVPTITEVEINRVSELLISTDASRDYGISLKEKYSNQKAVLTSIDGMPQSVQSKVLMMYDYLSDLSGADTAANYIANTVAPSYKKTETREGSRELLDPLGDDLVSVNFTARPATQKGFSTTHILNAFTLAGKGVSGDVSLTYDETSDIYTIGTSSKDLKGTLLSDLERYRMSFTELKAYLGVK